MPEFTNHQLLLQEIRKRYCFDMIANLARAIDKDYSYVGRLFYPIGKKGGKGIGLEIMAKCTEAFNLKPGFWEQDATTTKDVFSIPGEYIASSLHLSGNGQGFDSINNAKSPGINAEAQTPYGWPFGNRILPWQYNDLTPEQKHDIEKYVLLQISAKDPPLEQRPPANMEKTGTNS